MVYRLTKNSVSAIERALSKGVRVELIPSKDGIRLIKVQRHDLEVPTEPQDTN